MHLCYMDESGTSSIPGNTNHFVLVGLAIPVSKWKSCEAEIQEIKKRHFLENAEIHTGWICRRYLEQLNIPGFSSLNSEQRRREVMSLRIKEQNRLKKDRRGHKAFRQIRKNNAKTIDYIHRDYNERRSFIREIAGCIASWDFARLFAEAIDKTYFLTAQQGSLSVDTVDYQAFEQVVSRFERYLENTSKSSTENYGLLIHDNNKTVEKKHTEAMKRYHKKGTLWTGINQIIETPLFVDSQLTSMVQIADLCAYALRRYLENGENELFDLVFKRADRKSGATVGVRHFADQSLCHCKICENHSRSR